MRVPITLAVEGTTDAAVARRLLDEVGLDSGPEYIKDGKPGLDQKLLGYNNAARFSCWLVLRDLDQDADCAPDLCQRLLRTPAAHMRLHVVVRAMEAWLLADAESISNFLSIPRSAVPADPAALPHPKRVLVDIARRSRKAVICEALVPTPGASVGPGYGALLTEFATRHWRPAEAATCSPSLARLREYLRRVAKEGHA